MGILSNLNHFKICPSWCCIDLLLHPFHPQNFGVFHYCGDEVSIIGSNKSYFFTAAARATLERGERGDTVFDILVVLLQLQYFLLGATVTKKILGLLPSFGNIFQSINTQTTPRSDTVLIGPKYFPNIVLFL